jgi:hypothetical protein
MRAKVRKIVIYSFSVCLLLFLLSCGDNITSSSSQGTLRVYLTDKPLDNVEHVYVSISTIEVHCTANNGEETETINLPAPDSPIDLLALQGREELLSSYSLEEGFYTHIKIVVTKGSVVLDTGEEFELTIPSGKVLIATPFTIEKGKLTGVKLDFDAEKSVKVNKTGGANPKYILRPVIQLVSVQGP